MLESILSEKLVLRQPNLHSSSANCTCWNGSFTSLSYNTDCFANFVTVFLFLFFLLLTAWQFVTRHPLTATRHPSPAEKSCRVNHTMRWFSRPKFRISGLHYTVTTQMEKESSNECSVFFLWTKETFRLRNLPSRNSTMFSLRPRRAKFPKAAKFLQTFQVLFSLWSRKLLF